MGAEGKAAASIWEWVPLVSIGPIRFGMTLDEARTILSCELFGRDEDHDADGVWTWHDVDETGSSFQTLDGVVVSASCERVTYQGRALHGLSEEEARELFASYEVRRGEYPADTTLIIDALDCLLTLDEQTDRVGAIAVGSRGG